jgi:hypothetical protein
MAPNNNYLSANPGLNMVWSPSIGTKICKCIVDKAKGLCQAKWAKKFKKIFSLENLKQILS